MTTLTDSSPQTDSAGRSPLVRSAAVEPIVAGFHPDPSICRVGPDYYLVHSSFEYWPGLPIWHSTDLVHWQQIGNALSSDEGMAGRARSSAGIYAPTIRHHDGRFWVITTDIATSGAQLLISARDPRGPWSTPQRLEGLQGIDPDLSWDGADCFVTYCSTSSELRGIAQARVDLASARVLEAPRPLWEGSGLAFPEAPHLHRRGDWWYLVLAEGGTERGHGVTVARSRRPTGPFEAHPSNPVLSHRSTTHPVQNVGHADLVERADGEWAAVYLGVRPRGVTPMFHVNGRETFLAGVRWAGGWPVFDEDRYRIEVPDRSFSDDFSGPLHPRWVSPGVPIPHQLHPNGRGAEVRAVQGDVRARNAILARVTDHSWAFTAEIEDIEGTAAVLLRLDDSHWAEIRIERRRATAVLRIGPLEQQLGPAVSVVDAPISGRVESVPSTTGGPDELRFSVEQQGVQHPLGSADGRYLSTEVAGGFTGRVVGVRATDGRFHLQSVAYRASDAEPALDD